MLRLLARNWDKLASILIVDHHRQLVLHIVSFRENKMCKLKTKHSLQLDVTSHECILYTLFVFFQIIVIRMVNVYESNVHLATKAITNQTVNLFRNVHPNILVFGLTAIFMQQHRVIRWDDIIETLRTYILYLSFQIYNYCLGTNTINATTATNHNNPYNATATNNYNNTYNATTTTTNNYYNGTAKMLLRLSQQWNCGFQRQGCTRSITKIQALYQWKSFYWKLIKSSNFHFKKINTFTPKVNPSKNIQLKMIQCIEN